jgi:pimeloyl-ACP methyl ester carboxylesterase
MDVEANGISIHYTLEGDGPPIVLLHGYQLDRSFWEPQARALRGRYRVIVPDLRGFGASGLGNVTESTMALMADDVRALLDRIGVREPIVLGGLSMGGYVALAFIRRYARRVRAFILADTRAGPDTDQARQGRLAIAEQVERDNSTRAAVDALYPSLMAPAGYTRPELVAHIQVMAARPSPAAIAAALRGMAARPDSMDLLPSITCPTLILVGEHDVLTPPGEAEAMHARIPGAELVQVPLVGHLATLEDPESVNRAILGFLDRHGI